MVVYTDSIHYAEQILPRTNGRWSPASFHRADVRELSDSLFDGNAVQETHLDSDHFWKHLFVVQSAPSSQYDLLIDLNRGKKILPEGILCVAGAGSRFHGFKNRAWSASPGNLHISVHLAPGRRIDHFGVGFTILAAVSVVDAIDRVPGLEGRAGIKWVNDILINDAKVCGVLAYTQTTGDAVSAAVLGIGLNVETTPSVEPTPFVPRVASLRDFAPEPGYCSQQKLFDELIEALDRNYRLLVEGDYEALRNRYRERSAVMDREVAICADDAGAAKDVIATGRVTGLGEDLELFLEGLEKPITKGRLILKD
jgi:BirA family biotin operon repressor/biotin-[acetyl-CoA-carboxylase] ligase